MVSHRGIRLKSDKILIELIIPSVLQIGIQSVSLSVQDIQVKVHILLQKRNVVPLC